MYSQEPGEKEKTLEVRQTFSTFAGICRLLNVRGQVVEKLNRKSLPRSISDRLTGEREHRGWGSALPKQPGLEGPNPKVGREKSKTNLILL